MLNPSYAILEVSIAVIFLTACFHAWRRDRLLEVASAAFYGLLLEEGDILIFRTYHYSPDFILRVDRVPLAIALAWAIIIYTCMHLSDAYGIARKVAPFADAVWAIMLDIAFDAVAIRLGFWTWVIPLDAGFFGVPAGNFYAWLFVAFSFSCFTRIARYESARRRTGFPLQLVVPFIAYVGLLVSMVPFFVLRNAFFPERGGGLPIFWAVLAVFVLIVAREMVWHRASPSVHFDWLPVLLRSSFHIYFLAALLVTRIFTSLPTLLVISTGMLLVEVALVLVVWNRSRYGKSVAKQRIA